MGNSASVNLRERRDKPNERRRESKTSSEIVEDVTKSKKTDLVSSYQKRVEEKVKARQKILEEHPILRDVLNHVGEIADTIKRYEDIDVQNMKMSLAVSRCLEDLFNYFFEYPKRSYRKLISMELIQKRLASSFVSYMNILTNNGQEYPVEGYKFECYQLLRKLCWNYSDASKKLCEEFERAGILPLMLQDLKKLQDSFTTNEAHDFIVLSAMSILFNCAKSSSNGKYYKEMKAVETVAWYAKNTTDLKHEKVLAPLSAMTLAYIVDEENNSIISADNSLIKTILTLLRESLSSPNHLHAGFSTVELTDGLTKLATNADNSEVIINLGVADYLKTMLTEGKSDLVDDCVASTGRQALKSAGNDFEKASAAKALWGLSFSDNNKSKIVRDEELMEALKQAAESSVPKIKNAASGALWILHGATSKQVTKPVSPKNQLIPKKKKKRFSPSNAFSLEPLKEQRKNVTEEYEEEEPLTSKEDNGNVQKNHVMISYQWDKQELMIRLKLRLEEHGYNVWMDIDEMGGSTLQSMAEAVENATVVLVCFSQKYKDSVSCRTEAEYAYKCKKFVIPLRVESQYEADGWLGAILGTKFFYDFSILNMFEKTFSGLLKELGERGKKSKALKIIRTVAQVTAAMPKVHRISNWTQEEVKSWVKEKNIPSFQSRNIDGQVLLFLRRLKRDAPEFFYRQMSEKHGLSSIKDLMMFSNALDSLN